MQMALVTKHDVPFLGFLAATLGLRLLPTSLRFRSCEAISKRLGSVWYQLDHADAALTRRNLQSVLGSWLSASQVDATARALFQNIVFSKLVNDMLPALTVQDLKQFLYLEGEEHLKQALALGHGVVLLGVHFGLHSYIPLMLLKHLGYPVAAVLGQEIRPDDSWVYRHVIHPVRRRARLRLHVIEPTGMPQRELANILRQNQVLMILGDVLDQDVLRLSSPHVLPVPLLERLVLLKTGPFRLARWLGAPIVPFFVVSRPDGFAVVIESPLTLNDERSVHGLASDLTAFTARFESYLLGYPALWAHWRCAELLESMRSARRFVAWTDVSALQSVAA
jgi:lauroyl/myristoyl acyltransferase